MQAVILAAGEGRRMRPLTETKPKPLLEVAGEPLIVHVIDALPPEIDDVVIVVGYLGDMIRARLGARFAARRIRYVEQEAAGGTAAALALARPHLAGRFLVLCADDLHGAEALARACREPLAVIAAEHPEPSKFGVIEKRADGSLCAFIEKPARPASNLVSTGALVLDERVFAYDAPMHENGERYLTDQVAALATEAPVAVVTQPVWLPVGYPADLVRAEAFLKTI